MSIRLVKEDFVLKLEENQEVSLRKDDWIAIFPPILHMDPEVYEDPKVTIHLELHRPLQAHFSSQALCKDLCPFFAFSRRNKLLFFLVEQIFLLFQIFFEVPPGQRMHDLKQEKMVLRLTCSPLRKKMTIEYGLP